jgi:hypothetical protein
MIKIKTVKEFYLLGYNRLKSTDVSEEHIALLFKLKE